MPQELGGSKGLTFEELKGLEVFEYDTAKLPFQEIVSEMYGLKDGLTLDQIHTQQPGCEKWDMVELGRENRLCFYKQFYDHALLEKVLALYDTLIREVVAPQVKEDLIVIQRKPTYRVHIPNNMAVAAIHRDGDYAHQPGEINYWVPFTQTYESSTIITESVPEKGDFKPYLLKYGEILRFYGNQCRHYNKANVSGHTRCSFDFRVIPLSQYDPAKVKKTINQGIELSIGSYYRVYNKVTGEYSDSYPESYPNVQ